MKQLLLSTLVLANATAYAQQLTFTPAHYSTAAQGPVGVTTGDVNGDGRLDIIAGSYGYSAVSVLLGQAGGGFGTAISYPVVAGSNGIIPVSVAAGDLNNDGRLDIVSSGYADPAVMLGQAGGGFAPTTVYATGGVRAGGVALGDLNGDGRLDIVKVGNNSLAGVLLGQAGGGFSQAGTYSLGGVNNGQEPALGDVNNDGRLDIVSVASNGVGVLLGLAGGGFAPVTLYAAPGAVSGVYFVALGDVNNDGRLDIVLTDPNGVGVLLGQAVGGFGPVTYSATGTGYGGVLALGDFNQDGRLDAVAGGPGGIGVLPGLGTGSFGPASSYATFSGYAPTRLAVGDVDGNGKPDIVGSEMSTNTVSVFVNTTALATAPGLPGAGASVVPNPASHTATLTGTAPGQAVQVYDALGRLALTTQANTAGTATLTLPAGLYLVRSGVEPALRLVVE